MSLPVYLVESLGAPRNHHALFVELDPRHESGMLFHVTGNIQEGMDFEKRPTEYPKLENTYVAHRLLGTLSSSDLDTMEAVCRSNPPPEKQFDGPRRIDRKKPLRKCQEWTAETIRLLEQQGILRPASGAASSSSTSGSHTQPSTDR
ncbi:uncharacterized protein E0L32_008022 [Thyridium curvatum]|uniref:Uncharacterized protein n=1 Tax=Thyridium curvatum TaxID=1093900 RepID=A0A507AKH1_9PEZI|nr:uncharacterized protein E0L32_008022 [Thyridium curvatum]TPX10985.1 hypothetical protein E0L32_008022 [Thyridium curvatum]